MITSIVYKVRKMYRNWMKKYRAREKNEWKSLRDLGFAVAIAVAERLNDTPAMVKSQIDFIFNRMVFSTFTASLAKPIFPFYLYSPSMHSFIQHFTAMI